MSRLTVIADPFSGRRQVRELCAGARVADELMRLFPRGLGASWSLYSPTLAPIRQLQPEELPELVIRPGDELVLVRGVAGDPLTQFFIHLAISVLLSVAAKLLTPRPQRRLQSAGSESLEAGNNQIAAQSNTLRPGARVPELIGTVRSYPDLLTYPLELWERRSQTIEQWFCVGMGHITWTAPMFGETSASDVNGTITPFVPGALVEPIPVVKQSATVADISLTADDNFVPAVPDITFDGPAKTMTSPVEPLSIIIGTPVTIGSTGPYPAGNDGTRFVTSVSGSGPYVYTLAGSNHVVTQGPTNPSFIQWVNSIRLMSFHGVDVDTNDITFDPLFFGGSFHPGDAVKLTLTSVGQTRYGKITTVTDVGGGKIRIDMSDFDNVLFAMPTLTGESIAIATFQLPLLFAADAAAPSPFVLTNQPTAYHTVPMDDATHVLIDVSFPRGIAKFHNGNRSTYRVEVEAEFQRGGSGTTLVLSSDDRLTAAGDPGPFEASTSAPLRYTWTVLVSALGSLTGTGPLKVRLRRVTAVETDTATDQWVSDTLWASLRGMKRLSATSTIYSGVTLCKLFMANTNGATSLGENSLNMVATTRRPRWDGSTWNAVDGSTWWADHFIARLKASDGAALTDAEIDVAGIYALQATLNGLDGGDQGVISLTLDQPQDIDSELAQLADVVRAQVYRVGRKVFVVRDAQTAQRIGLFNGRNKSADAESVALRLKSDDDHDAVTVTWVDAAAGYKQRDYQYPVGLASNVLRTAPTCANWAQAYRRARFEWAKLKYRREQMTVQVTSEGRIVRPGDVVNLTDDIANLAIAAGEVLYISALVLTLDKDVTFGAGGHTLLVRDVLGQVVDAIPCTVVAGSPNKVQLARAPIGMTIKARDESLGTLYAFYNDAAATVRPWIISQIEGAGPYQQLTGANYTDRVYEADAIALPAKPALPT